jgi:dTDP-4-amino-4,6-dideoxygalactose transaminase
MGPLRLASPLEVPFSRPFLAGKELEYVTQAVEASASDGPFTRKCAYALRSRFNLQNVLMVPSCSAALDMAGVLFDLGPGDEVLLPSFTFTSTANSIVQRGATPVFVEIRPDTLNIDEQAIERHITKRTKAIIPVHYAGVACEMDSIMSLARGAGLKVMEDAAQAVNSSYHGRPLGSIGDLGAYSFHSTKNFTCGEGGALCVNAPELAERAEILRDKGTNRARYFRGEVDKYTWMDAGFSQVPTELACAYLLAQLEAMDRITDLRRAAHERYLEYLSSLEADGLLRLPVTPEGCESNYHLFYVLCPDADSRDRAIADLRRNKIQVTFHFVPLHCSPMGQRLGYKGGTLPITEDVSGRLLRLPLHPTLTAEEQHLLAKCLRESLEASSVVRQQAGRSGGLGNARICG